MEVSGTIAGTALRVGIQVVSNLKRPSEGYTGRDVVGDWANVVTMRSQEAFVSFSAINVGGVRAENVAFRVGGEFRRNPPREDFGDRFRSELPHVGPGQMLFLLSIDVSDFDHYEPGVDRPARMKTEPLEISVEYDGPDEGLNRIGRRWALLRKRKQYRFTYLFNPASVFGDLPPAEYG